MRSRRERLAETLWVHVDALEWKEAMRIAGSLGRLIPRLRRALEEQCNGEGGEVEEEACAQALARLEAPLAGCQLWVQGDPRGCVLWLRLAERGEAEVALEE
jgi:hypothetical protein